MVVKHCLHGSPSNISRRLVPHGVDADRPRLNNTPYWPAYQRSLYISYLVNLRTIDILPKYKYDMRKAGDLIAEYLREGKLAANRSEPIGAGG